MGNIDKKVILIKRLMLIVFIGMVCIGFAIGFQLQILAVEKYQITSFDTLDQKLYEVENTSEEDLQFPKTLTAQGIGLGTEGTQKEIPEHVLDENLQEVSVTILNVKWNCEEGYNKDMPGKYHFKPIIPAEYILNEGVELPTIFVTVKDSNDLISSNESGDKYLVFNQETNTITGYSSSIDAPMDIVIPEKINGAEVLYIGESAFQGQQLTSVVLNNNLLAIGNSTFSDCSRLTSITIPDSVRHISDNAFFNCKNLITITIKGSDKINIDSNAFNNGVNSLERTIIFEDRNIGSIINEPWGDSLATFIYKDGTVPPVEYEKDGFIYSPRTNTLIEYSGDLTEITIPDEIEIAGRKYSIEDIGDSAFKSNSKISDLTIPNGILSIGDNAFYNCWSLKNITISESVMSIGNSAFYNCGLKSLVIPKNVIIIGDSAFYWCSNLTNITIANGLTSIGDSAFYKCWNITKVIIPESVTSIGESAFSNCSKLVSVTIKGSGILNISKNAFSGTDALKRTITFEDRYIGSVMNEPWGDDYCTIVYKDGTVDPILIEKDGIYYDIKKKTVAKYVGSATNVVIESKIEVAGKKYSIESIGDSAFKNCNKITSVTISNGITSIGNYAFFYCVGLTNITIPESVANIGDYAFCSCWGLRDITIPENITSIENCVFLDCRGLRSITIPKNVTSIGSSAFDSCGDLLSVTIKGDGQITINEDAFKNQIATLKRTITFEDRSKGSVGNFPWGDNYAKIVYKDGEEKPIYIYQDYFIYNTRLKAISGYGITSTTEIVIPSKLEIENEVYLVEGITTGAFENVKYSLSRITIPNSIKKINGYTFFGFNKLKSVIIEEGGNDVHIGEAAFSGCSKLKNITIPNNVTSIGNCAFFECSSLTSITIPDSVTSIGDSAFVSCSALTSITIPKSVTSIESSVFRDCSGLTSIEIPESVKSIGDSAFVRCSRLTSITIPNSVTSIGNSAFFRCSGLTNIIIPSSVKSIEHSTFQHCTGLTDIKIPSSVTSIGYYAFNGCTRLKSITIPSSVTSLSLGGLFQNCSNLSNVIFSEGVVSFDPNLGDAFSGCEKLKTIIIPSTFTKMGPTMFSNSGIETIYIRQAKGSNVDHKYQPWGAAPNTKVYYAGEFIDFDHTVEKNINGGFDISIKASITRKGVLINMITLPDEIGGVVNVGAQQWPSSGVKKLHVNSDGEYIFKGTDTNGIETEYAVSFRSANIVYNENNGDTSQIVKYEEIVGNKYTIKDEYNLEFTKKEAIFKGFNTLADGSGTDYKPGEEINVPGDITLYAVWEDIPKNSAAFRVRYGDEELGSISKTVYNGVQGEILGNNVAVVSVNTDVEGAKFIGWYKNNKKIDTIREEKLIEESTVYEARFILDRNSDDIDDRTLTYPVHFIIRDEDKGKAIINTSRIDVKYNHTIGIFAPNYLIDEEVAPNVTFDGWYKNGVKIAQLGDEVITNEVTYEARFDGDFSRYRMIYIINGEDGKLNDSETYITQIIEKDGAVNIPSVKANEGKIFTGWYKEGDENQTLVSEEDIKLECATYIAQIKESHHVNFKVYEEDRYKGKIQSAEIIVAKGTYLKDILPVVTPQKWAELKGWYIGSQKIEDVSQYTVTEDITVEARFEAAEGVIILPGEDEKENTLDDIIIHPGKIDDKGNIIIPDGGEIIYPDGSQEEFPNGGIILPGESGIIGTEDDVIVKSGTIDAVGNIVISNGGTVIYPDGSYEDFPSGGIILPGEDRISGTKDDVIVKVGSIDNEGNIIIFEGGSIIYPDGRREYFPNGGILYVGIDEIFGTQDDLLVRKSNNDEQPVIGVLTNDNTQIILWVFMGVISMIGIVISLKKKLKL